MANDSVKVVGYAQKIFFDNGIEFRNFSPDLVGQQFVSEGGSTLFTMANFNITTNIQSLPKKTFIQNKFSKFFTLNELTDDAQVRQVVNDTKLNPVLKLDRSNLSNYAMFGSLTEFARVSLEEIIMKWPASLFISSSDPESFITGDTVEDYVFNSIKQVSNFKISTERIDNKFNINFLRSGETTALTDEDEGLRNLSASFTKYVISNSLGDFTVLGFTGATESTDDFIKFAVAGNPFPNISTTSSENYHVKPNVEVIEIFFNLLSDFQDYLLNRLVKPLYTATFKFPVRSEIGVVINQEQTLTWPVTDGYNIDFNTNEFVLFVDALRFITDSFDETKSNLIVRQLTSESISDFDSIPQCDGDIDISEGQKMNKTLTIYGREFDEIKRHIDGIKFANTVTYDGKDNIPDAIIKNLARVMGWEMITSVLEDDLLQTYLRPSDNTFSGSSRGLTANEAEIELWRRIILNTPWIWKSKGHRKVVEFFLKFIGAPRDLITLNEYVYVAKEPLNVEFIKDIIEALGFDDTILDTINVDSEGFPRTFPDTPDMYFQKGGLWYRETGGQNSMVDVLGGNNPHVGPYDGGKEYIDQFRCVIPNFSAVTVENEIITTEEQNIFTKYNSGLINNSTEEVTFDTLNLDGVSIANCYDVVGEIVDDPKPTAEITDCGCETGEGDQSLRFMITKLEEVGVNSFSDCGFSGFSLNPDGFVEFEVIDNGITRAASVECCESLGFSATPVTDLGTHCTWKNLTSCLTYVPEYFPNAASWLFTKPDGKRTKIIESTECCRNVDVGNSEIFETFKFSNKLGGENRFQCITSRCMLNTQESIILDNGTLTNIVGPVQIVQFKTDTGIITPSVSSPICCGVRNLVPERLKGSTQWVCLNQTSVCPDLIPFELLRNEPPLLDNTLVFKRQSDNTLVTEVTDPACCTELFRTATPTGNGTFWCIGTA